MRLFHWIKWLFARAPAALHGTSPFASGEGPTRLIVLRHSEKSGDKLDPHLSLPGRRRAEQLADYIPATFGQPQFLIAARTSNRSRRPVETLEPLAAALSLEVRAKFDDNNGIALIEALREKKSYRGKFGVICWRHSELPQLVAALGGTSPELPQRWADNDFNTIIEIYYPGSGEARATRLQMPF